MHDQLRLPTLAARVAAICTRLRVVLYVALLACFIAVMFDARVHEEASC